MSSISRRDLLTASAATLVGGLLTRPLGAAARPTAAPPRLIVRGDDMGFSHSGNEALIRCHTAGIETSIEVIVPSPWFPEAVRMLAATPTVDVGVHVALSSEWDNVKWRPVTDAPSLRDADGHFHPMIFPNPNYPGRALTQQAWQLADVEREFRAQIEIARRLIPRLSHLSGHMGCTDMRDDVKALTRRLAREYGIDVEPEALGASYVGFDGPHVTPAEKMASFLKTLDGLQPDRTYIFVEHPGLDDAELRAIHHIGYENVAADRQGVTDLWTSPRVRERIRARGIRLISYRDLKA